MNKALLMTVGGGFLGLMIAAQALSQGQYTPVAPAASGGGTYNNFGTYQSSTAAEGAARGMADVIRARGDANLSNSAAAVNFSEARKNEINNSMLYTNTYFEMRKVNRDARAAERGPKSSREELERMAHSGLPARLNTSQLDPVTGNIQWPRLLNIDDFAQQRTQLQETFNYRAANGTITASQSVEVATVTQALLEQLKTMIRQVPTADYMAARNFLQSLAYESRRPV